MFLTRMLLLNILLIFVADVYAADSTAEVSQNNEVSQNEAEPANQTTPASQQLAPPSQPSKSKVFWGGGIGLGFGTVDYVQIWPMVGVNVTPKLAVGMRLFYQYTSDSRYATTVTTNDYGATIFGRYFVTKPLFLQAEYEYLNYEFPSDIDSNGNVTTERTDLGSFLAGGGVRQIVGRNTSIYAVFLYNFTYEDDDRAYDSPWVIRFGVGVGM